MAGAACFYHGMEIIKNTVMLARWGENHNNYQRVVAAQPDTEKHSRNSLQAKLLNPT